MLFATAAFLALNSCSTLSLQVADNPVGIGAEPPMSIDIQVKDVKKGTLPIWKVPYLEAGQVLHIKLPQAANAYAKNEGLQLLVVFLEGASSGQATLQPPSSNNLFKFANQYYPANSQGVITEAKVIVPSGYDKPMPVFLIVPDYNERPHGNTRKMIDSGIVEFSRQAFNSSKVIEFVNNINRFVDFYLAVRSAAKEGLIPEGSTMNDRILSALKSLGFSIKDGSNYKPEDFERLFAEMQSFLKNGKLKDLPILAAMTFLGAQIQAISPWIDVLIILGRELIKGPVTYDFQTAIASPQSGNLNVLLTRSQPMNLTKENRSIVMFSPVSYDDETKALDFLKTMPVVEDVGVSPTKPKELWVNTVGLKDVPRAVQADWNLALANDRTQILGTARLQPDGSFRATFPRNIWEERPNLDQISVVLTSEFGWTPIATQPFEIYRLPENLATTIEDLHSGEDTIVLSLSEPARLESVAVTGKGLGIGNAVITKQVEGSRVMLKLPQSLEVGEGYVLKLKFSGLEERLEPFIVWPVEPSHLKAEAYRGSNQIFLQGTGLSSAKGFFLSGSGLAIDSKSADGDQIKLRSSLPVSNGAEVTVRYGVSNEKFREIVVPIQVNALPSLTLSSEVQGFSRQYRVARSEFAPAGETLRFDAKLAGIGPEALIGLEVRAFDGTAEKLSPLRSGDPSKATGYSSSATGDGSLVDVRCIVPALPGTTGGRLEIRPLLNIGGQTVAGDWTVVSQSTCTLPKLYRIIDTGEEDFMLLETGVDERILQIGADQDSLSPVELLESDDERRAVIRPASGRQILLIPVTRGSRILAEIQTSEGVAVLVQVLLKTDVLIPAK